MITTEELLKLKSKIDKGKNKLAELKGAEKSQLQALFKEYNLNSIEEAEIEIKRATAEIDKKEKQIEQLFEKLQNEFPILFE